ncbi:hypothetical protein KR50_02110 [Jeotgalibacillus campisalis]|uniref:Uncharacterized protein n=1 Tax=Jeotgalibacillus campisalis TaxID=220754 RepID=A0A0C2VVE4_9BACL|nr:hypothetical protein KR50_02110 [Jeotgalibacillus campisalis]
MEVFIISDENTQSNPYNKYTIYAFLFLSFLAVPFGWNNTIHGISLIFLSLTFFLIGKKIQVMEKL